MCWNKSPNGKGVSFIASDETYYFTKEDLEEGLRMLTEKPIFEATDSYGKRTRFQKRNEVVMFEEMNEPWTSVETINVRMFTNEELEAIIKARNS